MLASSCGACTLAVVIVAASSRLALTCLGGRSKDWRYSGGRGVRPMCGEDGS